MEECYLKAIEKYVKQNFLKMAGLTCLEAAESFLKIKNFERSYQYFIKGIYFSKFIYSF